MKNQELGRPHLTVSVYMWYNFQALERGNYMSGAQPSDFHKLRDFFDRRKVVFILALVISSLVVTGFVWSQKSVSIVADGNNSTVHTLYNNPIKILAQAGIYLGPKDEFRMSTETIINGTKIEVRRAVPVTIVFQDKTEVITTAKITVGELAESLGYSAESSKTIPAQSTELAPMMQVTIIALSEKLVTQTLPIPAPVIRQPDAAMEINEEETTNSGKDGVKEVTEKVHFENGQQVSSEVVSEKTVEPPIPQIIKVGTRDTIQTSRGARRFRNVRVMEASAYTPDNGSGSGITASGIPARRGVIAVDPRVIPLGTRVFIPGYGMALAADTGGDIIGDRIDVCVESTAEAWSYGRRAVKVYEIAD